MEMQPPSTSTSAGAGAEQDAPASSLPSAEGRDVPRSGSPNQKRTDVLSWDEYFMSVAFLSSKRSKDRKTQVGACIVNEHNRIVGTGYNGMPNGCSDDEIPWGSAGDNQMSWAVDDERHLQTKRPYVCHAELNAVMNKFQADIRGCRIYVTLFPCNECAKLIIQSGITEVIYYSDKYHKRVAVRAAGILFKNAKVKYSRYDKISAKTSITINFEDIN